MNGLQAFAILIAVIIAFSAGMIVYTNSAPGGAPTFPTKGTYTHANGDIAFDGDKSRVTVNVEGNRHVTYANAKTGVTTKVVYSTLPAAVLPAGETDTEQYTYFDSATTTTETPSADGQTGTVTGTFVSESDGVKTYLYTVGSDSVSLSFNAAGVITKVSAGTADFDLVSFSPTVTGSLDFDEAAAKAGNAAVTAKVQSIFTSRRSLMQAEGRDLNGLCGSIGGYWDAAVAFYNSRGTYGNFCGKGQPWYCKNKAQRTVRICENYVDSSCIGSNGANCKCRSGSLNAVVTVCADGGADQTCAKHDHGGYSKDIFGIATANYCLVDANFQRERNSGVVNGFNDGTDTDRGFIAGANCLFKHMPCLDYGHYTSWGWCSRWWGGYPCKKSHHGEHTHYFHYGNYNGKKGTNGNAYKNSY